MFACLHSVNLHTNLEDCEITRLNGKTLRQLTVNQFICPQVLYPFDWVTSLVLHGNIFRFGIIYNRQLFKILSNTIIVNHGNNQASVFNVDDILNIIGERKGYQLIGQLL